MWLEICSDNRVHTRHNNSAQLCSKILQDKAVADDQHKDIHTMKGTVCSCCYPRNCNNRQGKL